MRKVGTRSALGGRQDFLIPRVGNPLLRFRPGLQPWQPMADGHRESGGADLTGLLIPCDRRAYRKLAVPILVYGGNVRGIWRSTSALCTRSRPNLKLSRG
jgi:hypothetical protein